jgi:hypothetical protein
MVSLLINDKEVSVKSGWDEISAGLGEKLLAVDPAREPAVRDRLALFNLLADRRYGAMLPTDDYQVEAMITACTGFLLTPMPVTMPTELKLGKRRVSVPKDLTLSVAQCIHFRQLTRKVADPMMVMSKLTAILLQPHVLTWWDRVRMLFGWRKEFDYKEAISLVPAIEALPITQVYPVADFFASKLKRSGMSSTRSSRQRTARSLAGAPRWQRSPRPSGSTVSSRQASSTDMRRSTDSIRTWSIRRTSKRSSCSLTYGPSRTNTTTGIASQIN